MDDNNIRKLVKLPKKDIDLALKVIDMEISLIDCEDQHRMADIVKMIQEIEKLTNNNFLVQQKYRHDFRMAMLTIFGFALCIGIILTFLTIMSKNYYDNF